MKQRHWYSVTAGTVVAILILLVGCTLLATAFTGEEEVTLILPALPRAAVLSGLHHPVWTVSWYDGGSRRHQQTVEGSRCVLTLEKGVCTPVLAEIVTTNPCIGPFPPAGSIYPSLAKSAVESSTLYADWFGGIAADAACRAFESAQGGIPAGRHILSRFNWRRFVQELGKLDYPEYFDVARFVTALLSGRVRVHDIRMLPLIAVPLEIPAGHITEGSSFYTAWPGPALFSWTAAHTCSIEMPRRTTRLYASDGYITVIPSSPGGECAFFCPYSLQE